MVASAPPQAAAQPFALDAAAVEAGSAAHPKPPGFSPSYGTAGFRCDASLLDSTVFRCGLLIAARALGTGAACGVMITASHNVDSDNGVKLVEPSGEMLEPDWEGYATRLAQADGGAAVAAELAAVLAAHPPAPGAAEAAAAAAGAGGGAGARARGPRVVVGIDTRASGPRLAAACRAGAAALGVPVSDVGVVTTPELHSEVVACNAYGALGEGPYLTSLAQSFRTLADGTAAPATPLYVDCANGVGGLKIRDMAPGLAALGLRLELANTGSGRLNHMCGADYVQKEQAFPEGGRGRMAALGVRARRLRRFPWRCPGPQASAPGLCLSVARRCRFCAAYRQHRGLHSPIVAPPSAPPPLLPPGLEDVPEGARCASIDGDADRVVFFTKRRGCSRARPGRRLGRGREPSLS
jgi:hypothetical protein